MSRSTTPEHLKWLRQVGFNLAPLTGTDTKALAAIAGSWTLYGYCGHDRVLAAIALLARQMQPSTRHYARELAAWAMNWSDRERLWQRVVSFDADLQIDMPLAHPEWR